MSLLKTKFKISKTDYFRSYQCKYWMPTSIDHAFHVTTKPLCHGDEREIQNSNQPKSSVELLQKWKLGSEFSRDFPQNVNPKLFLIL